METFLLGMATVALVHAVQRTSVHDAAVHCDPTTLDWDGMVSGSKPTPKSFVDFEIDPNALLFTFNVELEYLGNSTSRTSHSEVGTNYIIDFVPFTTSSSVQEANNCANRLPSSYVNRDWDEWWEFSSTPWLPGHVGSDEYLAYGTPSEHWQVSYLDINHDVDRSRNPLNHAEYACGAVVYHGNFSLSALMNCMDKNGKRVIRITEDEEYYSIEGKLYVSVISPISRNLRNLYKVYTLDTKSFEIKLAKSLHVLSAMSMGK